MASVTRVVKFIKKGDKGDPGTNYLILGWWSDLISYKLSDAGIPVVKVADSTSLGFSVYELEANSSTIGVSPAGSSEWGLVESAEFIYMQEAYIERLQAAIVTAERIEALEIRTSNLEVLTGAKVAGFDIGQGRIGVVQAGDNPTNKGLALYNEFIKFSNDGSRVFFGTNVLPGSSGTTALARLESTYIDDIKKYGLIINVSGANSYFGGNNNVGIALEKGVIDRLRWQIRAKNASSGSHVFTDETEVVLYLSSSNYYVVLPAYPEVGEIKIITRVNEYNLQVRGNGNEILNNTTSATSTSIFFGPGYTLKSRSLIFRWDGNFWIMNTWT